LRIARAGCANRSALRSSRLARRLTVVGFGVGFGVGPSQLFDILSESAGNGLIFGLKALFLTTKTPF
jgi:hypothetical protein